MMSVRAEKLKAEADKKKAAERAAKKAEKLARANAEPSDEDAVTEEASALEEGDGNGDADADEEPETPAVLPSVVKVDISSLMDDDDNDEDVVVEAVKSKGDKVLDDLFAD